MKSGMSVANNNLIVDPEDDEERKRLQRMVATGTARVKMYESDWLSPNGKFVFYPGTDPNLVNDIRDVLDWMHTEVATSSQAGIIEPRDRDRLMALVGRVEAWLVEQGEAV